MRRPPERDDPRLGQHLKHRALELVPLATEEVVDQTRLVTQQVGELFRSPRHELDALCGELLAGDRAVKRIRQAGLGQQLPVAVALGVLHGDDLIQAYLKDWTEPRENIDISTARRSHSMASVVAPTLHCTPAVRNAHTTSSASFSSACGKLGGGARNIMS